MALAMSSTAQQMGSISCQAGKLQRTTFTGTPLALASRTSHRSSLLMKSLTPQAIFSRNKEQQGKRTGYDKGAKEVEPLTPAFTRRREVFVVGDLVLELDAITGPLRGKARGPYTVKAIRENGVGRLAMLGFASSLLGEIATGKGALGQLQLELGLPSYGVDLLVLGILGYSLAGAFNPATYSESNQRDVKKRNPGPSNKANIYPDEPGKYFGTTGFGFTKKNEVFVGRTAQLGFLASVIGEKITGVGPLQQFGFETGIPVGQASIGLLIFIAFFLVAAIFTGNYGDEAIKDDKTY